jgi:hypothetical protein
MYRPFDGPDPNWRGIKWQNDGAELDVIFGNADTVIYFELWEMRRVKKNPIGDLVWRARRQWHQWFP